MASVVVNIPDSVDLSKVNDIKLCIRYCKNNDEYSYVTDGFSIQEERPQGEWIKVTKAGTVPVEYICSLCRRKIYDNYELTTPIDEFYPFCHCGADMRKGGAE